MHAQLKDELPRRGCACAAGAGDERAHGAWLLFGTRGSQVQMPVCIICVTGRTFQHARLSVHAESLDLSVCWGWAGDGPFQVGCL